jgi:hypothetical protein
VNAEAPGRRGLVVAGGALELLTALSETRAGARQDVAASTMRMASL